MAKENGVKDEKTFLAKNGHFMAIFLPFLAKKSLNSVFLRKSKVLLQEVPANGKKIRSPRRKFFLAINGHFMAIFGNFLAIKWPIFNIFQKFHLMPLDPFKHTITCEEIAYPNCYRR